MIQPDKCPVGTYNDKTMEPCKKCPGGYACFDVAMETYLLDPLGGTDESLGLTYYQCPIGHVINFNNYYFILFNTFIYYY